MANIVVSEFISLDGVMEAPGAGEEYRHGGLTFTFDRGADGDRFKLDEILAAEALLLGRRTHDGCAATGPSMEGEFADKFNAMAKYVVSSTLSSGTWNNTTVVRGNIEREVTRLRMRVEGHILVNGSARLLQTLVERDLVDELRLMVFSIGLGSGQRLFERAQDVLRYRRRESRVVGEGIAILTYTR